MQQELRGQPLERIFSYVDPQPLASASVAQVNCKFRLLQLNRKDIRHKWCAGIIISLLDTSRWRLLQLDFFS
jgi:hypothetical protein